MCVFVASALQETASEMSLESSAHHEKTCSAAFKAEEEGELTVQEGDVVKVLKPPEGGWVLVALNEQSGRQALDSAID